MKHTESHLTPEREGNEITATETLKREKGGSRLEELCLGGFLFHLFSDRAAQ